MTVRRQDQDRLTLWVDQHGRAVRGYVLALVRQADVADDLVQEVFQRAWQARDRYRENGAARAYLLKIADRLVCDRARRPAREVTLDEQAWQRLQPADAELGPAAALGREEARRQLGAALDALTPAQRRVLLLRYYGQLSFADIAAALECPLNTVLSHCRRGLVALRKTLCQSA